MFKIPNGLPRLTSRCWTISKVYFTMNTRPQKRLKLGSEHDATPSAGPAVGDPLDPVSIRSKRAAFLSSISRSISPPAMSRSRMTTPREDDTVGAQSRGEVAQPVLLHPRKSHDQTHARFAEDEMSGKSENEETSILNGSMPPPVTVIPSPFRLISTRDLPSSRNTETVSIGDILGNPLLKEAWVFNFCFDVDWLMAHLDPDVRSLVKVKIVHGSWKKEDTNRIRIEEACGRWPNVEAVTAYLPDPFGTHHSKMFVLFTHDDQAQVIIHTANMLHQDWTNMTQAVWQSPVLPKLKGQRDTAIGRMGSGSRFQHDLLTYLEAYRSKTKALRDQLVEFDFGSVRGALIASAPSRMKNFSVSKSTKDLMEQTLYGYPSLCRALRTVSPQTRQEEPIASTRTTSQPHIVCQISSIATLSMTWMNQFFPAISDQKLTPQMWNDMSIIYPTPDNVASSLDGYASGGSIHTKAQSAAHLKQITNLRRSLCQWTQGPREDSRAARHLAAPHIKTYVCFQAKPTQESPTPDIQWALLTSANLSTQAWGILREKDKEVVVQSFEIGVLVWPELFTEDFASEEGTANDGAGSGTNMGLSNKHGARTNTVRMVPVFGTDTPPPVSASHRAENSASSTLVGLRLPYDLPLTPYAESDMPWSPQGTYDTPDRHGRRWPKDFYG